jgi:hypothetical protein
MAALPPQLIIRAPVDGHVSTELHFDSGRDRESLLKWLDNDAAAKLIYQTGLKIEIAQANQADKKDIENE